MNKSKQSIPTLSLDDTVANPDVNKANLLKLFFCSFKQVTKGGGTTGAMGATAP